MLQQNRTLGIFISHDEKGNYKKNITEKIEKMDNRLNFWRSRSLTLLGRCLIFKSLGIPQLIYSASMSSMPTEASVKLITNYLFNFIWNKKPDKIKRQVMYQDYMDGGLRVPNILTTFKSLNLAWIPRLLKSENCSDESWSYIPSYYFKMYGGLKGPLKYLVAKLHSCYPSASSLPVSQNFFAHFFRRRPIADSSHRYLFFDFAGNKLKKNFSFTFLLINFLLYSYNM